MSKQFNPKWSSLRHILIKLSKIKDKKRRLKVAREKKSHIHGYLHKAISRFLNREWNDMFKVLKESIIQPRMLHPENKGKKKTFSDQKKIKKQKELITTRLDLQ